MNDVSRLQLAFSLMQQQRCAAARDVVNGVLALSPNNVEAIHLLGLICKQEGDVVRAENLLRRSIELQPRRAEFHANLANLLRRQQKIREALNEYEDAVAIDPHHRPALLGLAQALNESRNFAVAEQHARALVNVARSDASAWSVLAAALRGQHRFVEAEAAYHEAIAKNQRSAIAHHNLGAMYAQVDRAEEALAELVKAKQLGATGYEIALNTAHALFKLYRFDAAEAAYVEAIRLAPGNIDAQRSLSRLRFMRGDPDFVRDIRAALALHPQDERLQLTLADVLRTSGDLEGAKSLLLQLLADRPDGPHFHGALAAVYVDGGRFLEAEPHARIAARALPGVAAICELLVMICLALQKADEAMSYIQAQRASSPFEQRWIAYEASALRLLQNPRYAELYDYDRFVKTYDLNPPPGWESMVQFNAALVAVLEQRHRFVLHPFDQSLRHGSQTTRSLLADPDPSIRALMNAFDEPLAEYVHSIGSRSDNPLSARSNQRAVIDKCWSVRLSRGGFHVSHVHPEGWISSAYYVDAPSETEDLNAKSGWIKFGEPRVPIPGATPELFVQPKLGRLVLFPSYMWHGTTALRESHPRLTVAFDAVPSHETRGHG
jgi:Flp pilus assembly protein TadD